MTLRVANVIEDGKLGGPQIRIVNVARALKGKVETVVILPIENSELFRKKLDESGVLYYALSLSRITKEAKVALRYLFFSWLEVIRLIIYFRKERFDLIHVSGGAWQFKGVLAGKFSGTKVVWHLNDTLMPKFIKKIFSYISGVSDAYIFASEKTREYYRPLIPDGKYEYLVPAPVDASVFNGALVTNGDESLITSWEGKLVFGSVANINPIKGLDVFVKAAAAVNRLIDNAIFVVIGPVYKNQEIYFNKIQALCGELGVNNVEFVGGRDDIRPLLKRFDIYLCTSYAESSPISVWEAMSMGKAVVSTDVGDVSKYVREGVSGEVVSVGDAQAIADKCVSLVNDRNRKGLYEKNASDIARRELDLSKCAELHLALYEEIVSSL